MPHIVRKPGDKHVEKLDLPVPLKQTPPDVISEPEEVRNIMDNCANALFHADFINRAVKMSESYPSVIINKFFHG